MHAAFHLKPGDDPAPERTPRVDYQELPGSVLGFPGSEVRRILRVLGGLLPPASR